MKILVINGPNLNLTGKREKKVYGKLSLEEGMKLLKESHPEIRFSFYQSNVEGEIINRIHKAEGNYEGIIINPGAYTHTSIAIADAISAVEIPVVEVHLSNIFSREDYRHISYTGSRCIGTIGGFGFDSYRLAAAALLRYLNRDLSRAEKVRKPRR
jgi:3-dehydroquinate dehydratase II